MTEKSAPQTRRPLLTTVIRDTLGISGFREGWQLTREEELLDRLLAGTAIAANSVLMPNCQARSSNSQQPRPRDIIFDYAGLTAFMFAGIFAAEHPGSLSPEATALLAGGAVKFIHNGVSSYMIHRTMSPNR